MSLRASTPHAGLPRGAFDTTYSDSVADALESLLEHPWMDRSWWFRARPRDASTSTTPPTLLEVDVSTDGHRTRPTDAETLHLPEAIIEPYSVNVSLQELWGLARMTLGLVVIGNVDGSRSHLVAEDWVGRRGDIYLGPRGGRQVEFARVAQLVSREIEQTRSDLRVQLDDYSFQLDAPIQTTNYAGTGGLEGGDDIKGLPKPLLFGIERQFEPVEVDPVNHVYQIHDGAFEAVLAAEDGKGGLTLHSDVANITTVTPAAGQYATSLATGYLKLGEAPETVLTVSAKGHNSSSLGYVETVAGLTRLLLTEFAALAEGELDGNAFATLASHTPIMGHWTGTRPESVRSILDRFLRSAAAWAWLRPHKVMTVGRISDPDAATASFSLNADRDELRFEPWANQPYEIPVGRVRVGYRRYSRTLSDTEVLGAVADATRADAAKEYRYAIAEDSAVFAQTPDADELEILTNLDTEADAQALAAEQLALRKVRRRLGTFAPRRGLIRRGIGDVFELTDSRLPTSPKKWVIIGLENQAEKAGEEDRIVWRCLG